jgi:amino-acid N-acetyltransferase
MSAKLRRAAIADVAVIQKMVNEFADRGEMLPRSLSELYENIRDYYVVECDGAVVGCAALHVTWGDLAEVKSVAVHQHHRGAGLGRQLVRACLRDARALGVPRLFVLTYIPEFFRRFGFHQVEKSELPHKVWSECVRCPKFPDCGEVGMVLELRQGGP